MAMMIPSTTALRALRQTLHQLTLSTSTQATSPRALVFPVNQVRHSSILADLRDIRSQHTNKKRLGRGPSSGKGKTSGRGHKGQGQRKGKPKNFEGGQTPQWILHPEKGFKNPLTKIYSALNLSTIQLWIDQGRIDPTKPITMKELLDTRAVHGIKDGVKLLARDADHLKVPIDITISKASQKAIEKIEAVGGKVSCRFFTKEGVRSITHPHLFPNGYRLANPTARSEIEYYRDPAHRGYLSDQVKAGETPSLYWYRKPEDSQKKKSEEEIEQAKKNRELRKAHAENRMF